MPSLASFRSFLLCCGALLAFATLARADSITIPAVADTSLFELNPTNNLGQTEIIAGSLIKFYPNVSRGLIKFNVSAYVPEGAVINSVSMKIWVVTRPNDPAANDSNFNLRRMLLPWAEGNKAGVLGDGATSGETTWNFQYFNQTPWSVPGGAEGVEYSATISSTVFISGETDYNFDSTANLVADVQGWLDNPSANHGWMIKNEDESMLGTARRFAARHSGLPAPSLTISFTPPIPLSLSLTNINNGTFGFSFPAEASRAYTVQYRDAMNTGSWNTLTNLPAPGQATNFFITDTHTNQSRFYRVRSL